MVTGHFGLAAAASRTERAAGVIRGGRANLVTALIVVSGLVVLTLDVLTA
jgi:hypothetical protein